MTTRRSFMKGVGAVGVASILPRPAIAQSNRDRTLIFVPENDVSILDPLVSTANSTAFHAYCVFDTLYGIDASYEPRPQMVEGHTVSDDERTWDLKLREGLAFHDGEPVLPRDCIASLQRWSKRDAFGQILARHVDAWESVDDRTIRIRLKERFPALPHALAHPIASAAFIMPERLASTDPATAITEMVGSGPLRFVQDEYVPGSQLVYSRFEKYVPRQEDPVGTAGGKVVHFDRFEWRIMPDAATVYAALQTGEVDWWNVVAPNLVEQVLSDPSVKVEVSDPVGETGILRFNCLQKPFDNPKLRNIILRAVNQSDFMSAVTGDYENAWKSCYSMFNCGLPGIKEVGSDMMAGAKDFEALRKEVVEAGYKGEGIVIMNAVDSPTVAPLGQVAAALLRQLGFNVDLQEMDWATVQRRRTSKDPASQGGWHMFPVISTSAVMANPALNIFIRGQGEKGWFGWYENARIEALTNDWLNTGTAEGQAKIYDEIQALAFQDPPSVPLGKFFKRTAFSKGLTGFVPGSAAVMWNMRRA